jgi:acetoin utilization deacetylase AcuC-like enzyme
MYSPIVTDSESHSNALSKSNSKERVTYYYDEEIGNFYYGMSHPMKPHRMRMAHTLVTNYGLYKHMQVIRPQLTSEDEMTGFHADDYVQFLRHITPGNVETYVPFYLSGGCFMSLVVGTACQQLLSGCSLLWFFRCDMDMYCVCITYLFYSPSLHI